MKEIVIITGENKKLIKEEMEKHNFSEFKIIEYIEEGKHTNEFLADFENEIEDNEKVVFLTLNEWLYLRLGYMIAKGWLRETEKILYFVFDNETKKLGYNGRGNIKIEHNKMGGLDLSHIGFFNPNNEKIEKLKEELKEKNKMIKYIKDKRKISLFVGDKVRIEKNNVGYYGKIRDVVDYNNGVVVEYMKKENGIPCLKIENFDGSEILKIEGSGYSIVKRH